MAGLEAVNGLRELARSGRLQDGPVARSGARSHPAWRRELSARLLARSLGHTMAAFAWVKAAL